MVQTLIKPETEEYLIYLPKTIGLYVTQEQFTALAASNRELRLERTAQGELIVNPPTGWETGKRNRATCPRNERENCRITIPNPVVLCGGFVRTWERHLRQRKLMMLAVIFGQIFNNC